MKQIKVEDYIINVIDEGLSIAITIGGGPVIRFTKDGWKLILDTIMAADE